MIDPTKGKGEWKELETPKPAGKMQGGRKVSRVSEEGQAEQGSAFEMLPRTVLSHILASLNHLDLQSASVVNHFWNETALQTAAFKEIPLIGHFIEFLGKHLEKDAYNRIKEIFEDHRGKIAGSESLVKIKELILEIKNQIIIEFGNFDREGLERLGELARSEIKPCLFENLFLISLIHKDLDTIVEELQARHPAEFQGRSREESINERLFAALLHQVDAGNNDAAIEVGKTRLSTTNFCILLFACGDSEKAMEIAKKELKGQSYELWRIGKWSLEYGRFKEAEELATMISEGGKFNRRRDILNSIIGHRRGMAAVQRLENERGIRELGP